ncbi:FmdB family zinc ribbon protein [Sediminispirochaeta smaragdinae]|uniref:Regulatory protein, FmdB family n=1 Tax=Sediminispirochaeta smaragdinae (strain DSM 11293 / JCM 15392 / SEBR 4228) TaxID=573413 RepID=E1R6K6_SEDSS|nr:FmdB family zinc ribbon protein [Sediminispirochaeta smaragdinae]ADK81024.1 regulatory protein, FmdB family [Sediminispirochaeta smaragdinae DSM 11293]
MPTYDYECDECGHTFEFFQAMSDDPISVCPKCGGHVRRLIGGGTGIIFKGSGFYVTDNKRTGASSTSSPINGDEKTKPQKSNESHVEKADSKKEPASTKG